MAQCEPESASADLSRFLASLQKAELHVHLEGTVTANTLWELVVQQRSELARRGREALDSLFQTSKFADFLSAFKDVCLHLRTPEDYELITFRALEAMAAQNVRYTEMILSAGVMIWRGDPIEPLFRGAARGARRAECEFGIQTRWIFDVVRQFPLEHAWQVVRAAESLRGEGVVAIGIGGDEAASPQKFCDVFGFAKERGLHRVAHAGEAAGPDSIWGALRSLDAERIGHGLTAAKDSALVQHLAANAIPVEVCLTSNLRTGGIAEIAAHPLRTYFDAGVPVSLHTDDPALFGTNLLREYQHAQEAFGFTRGELRQLAINSFQASFLSADEKREFLRAM